MVTLNDLFADFGWGKETPIGGEPTDYYMRSIKRENWVISLSYKRNDELASITIQPSKGDLLTQLHNTWMQAEHNSFYVWDVYKSLLEIEDGASVVETFQENIGGFKSVSSLLGDN